MMNVWEEADVAAELFETLDQLGTVYGPAPTSGRFNVVLKERLECRLVPIPMYSNVARTADRAELMSTRDLIFPPDYFMPEQCQVEIDGTRWTPGPGTFNKQRAGNSGVLLKRCQVTRQQGSAF